MHFHTQDTLPAARTSCRKKWIATTPVLIRQRFVILNELVQRKFRYWLVVDLPL